MDEQVDTVVQRVDLVDEPVDAMDQSADIDNMSWQLTRRCDWHANARKEQASGCARRWLYDGLERLCP